MEREELPVGWAIGRLDDALDRIIGGGTPSKTVPDYFAGTIPLMTVKDMKVSRPSETGFNITEEALQGSSAKIVPADTVIIATRMGLGKVVRPKMDTAINQDLKALFPSEALEKAFLEWWLHSVARKIEAMGTGTTVKGVRLNQVKALEIPLAPLAEQQRIVEKIETLFAELDKGKEALREVQKLLARYRQSVLRAAVTGELTADWRAVSSSPNESGQDLLARILKSRRETWQGRGKYKQPLEANANGLPALPSTWAWGSLDQLVSGRERSMQSGPFGSNLKHSEFQDTGVLVIGIDNVKGGKFSMGSENRISQEKYEALHKYTARAGDLLVTVMASLGRTCVIPDDLETAIITKHVYRITLNCELAEPKFYNLVLQAEWFSRWHMFESAQGQTRPGLNSSILRSMPLPILSRDEQLEAVKLVEEALSEADRLSEYVADELKRSAALRRSILKDAFSGKLVPQDPSDEPAEKLLDRIRAARLPQSNSKRRKAAA